MWIHVDPSNGLPIYMQIINQIKRATANGLLRPGDQLPSVRELAVELTVNPNTISKAYQELERDGIIKTVRGIGTFVSEKEIKIVHEEREKEMIAAIDRLLVEAHHLGFSSDELSKMLENRIKDWMVRHK
ncbi:MAG TPA: GntR family transcriptional regulator [Desulfobacteria bacterium]|nr:GntR family transcriptional regulator [Desulfobacteria bacterium]